MIHLDTNYLIFGIIPGTTEGRKLRTLDAAGESFGISTMAWAEFLCGPVSAQDLAFARALLPNPLPLTPDHSALPAHLFNSTGRRRHSLPDCLIAATAIHADATLATNNTPDFVPFLPHGLRLLTP